MSVDVTLEEVRDGLRDARYITTPRVETALFLALRLGEAAPRRGSGRRRQDRARQGAGGDAADRARPPAVLRGARRGARALRVELPEAAAAHPGRPRARGARGSDVAHDVFSREFLLERPLLRAITAPRRVVLLIDEIDKADPEFEAFLLEVLSDFQVSVPELGTIRGAAPAGRRAHVEPHARAVRGAAATLPAPLRRLPGRGEGGGDHRAQGARARRAAAGPGRALRRRPAEARSAEGAVASPRRSTGRAASARSASASSTRRPCARRSPSSLKHEDDLRKVEPKIASVVAARPR